MGKKKVSNNTSEREGFKQQEREREEGFKHVGAAILLSDLTSKGGSFSLLATRSLFGTFMENRRFPGTRPQSSIYHRLNNGAPVPPLWPDSARPGWDCRALSVYIEPSRLGLQSPLRVHRAVQAGTAELFPCTSSRPGWDCRVLSVYIEPSRLGLQSPLRVHRAVQAGTADDLNDYFFENKVCV